MITVCRIYNDFKGAMNTWQKGHFRPESFIYALYESVLETFNENKKVWEESQVVTDTLKVYFKSVQIEISKLPEGSVIKYPKDYAQFSSTRFYRKKEGEEGCPCKGIPVLNEKNKCRKLRPEEVIEAGEMEQLSEGPISKIDNKHWSGFLDDKFNPPSLNNVGCTQLAEGFKVFPNVGWVVLDYLSMPERPTFKYTKDDKQNIICDPKDCTNVLLDQTVLPELMSRLKTKYASFTGNEKKYAEGKSETKDAS